MSDIYVRELAPEVKAKLKAEAKKRGVSLNFLVKEILKKHILSPDVQSIEEKYTNFVKDITVAFMVEHEKNRESIENLTYLIKHFTSK